MILEYMHDDDVSTRIDVDYKKNTVKIKNYTNDNINRAFGCNEHPSMEDFEEFLEDRCFPRTRDHLKLILRDMGLDYYDPLAIVRITQGRLEGDRMWIRFVEG